MAGEFIVEVQEAYNNILTWGQLAYSDDRYEAGAGAVGGYAAEQAAKGLQTAISKRMPNIPLKIKPTSGPIMVFTMAGVTVYGTREGISLYQYWRDKYGHIDGIGEKEEILPDIKKVLGE